MNYILTKFKSRPDKNLILLIIFLVELSEKKNIFWVSWHILGKIKCILIKGKNYISTGHCNAQVVACVFQILRGGVGIGFSFVWQKF